MMTSIDPWFLLSGTEVGGIAALSGVVAVIQGGIILKMIDTLDKKDARHSEERAHDRDALNSLTAASHAAIDALKGTREVLAGRNQ